MKYKGRFIFTLSSIIITLLIIGCGRSVMKKESLETEISDKIAKVLNGEVIGYIDAIDEHKNAVTNITPEPFAELEWQIGDTLEVEFTNNQKIQCQYVKNYGDVPVGDYLVRFNSDSILKIAINEGYLADSLKIEKFSQVIIRKSDEKL